LNFQETIDRLKKNVSLPLVLIMVLGLLFRLFLMRYRWAVGFDEAHYVRMAESMLAGEWQGVFHPYWPPLYAIVTGLFAFLTGNTESAARVVGVVSNVLAAIPVYYFATRLFSKKIALTGVAAFLLFPPPAWASTSALSESLFGCLGLFALMTGWRALQEKSWGNAIATGVLSGASYLTKPEGIGYWMVFTGLALLILFIKELRKNAVAALCGSLIGFLLMAAPYIFYLKVETGIWTISLKYQVNQQFAALFRVKGKDPNVRFKLTENNKFLPTDLAYHDGRFQLLYQQGKNSEGTGVETIVRIGPAIMVKKFAENFYRNVSKEIPGFLTFSPLVFMILGLFRTRWGPKKVPLHLYLLSFLIFYWLLVFPLIHINPRYFLALAPVCFIWIGKGMHEMYNWFIETLDGMLHVTLLKKERWQHMAAISAVVLFTLFFSYLTEFGKIVKRDAAGTQMWEDAVELKAAGKWLKENTSSFPVVMSHNKAFDYYAGGRDIRLGASIPLDDDFSRILTYAEHKNVEYVAVSERYNAGLPNVSFLLSDDAIPSELEMVYEDTAHSGLKTRIFKFTPAPVDSVVSDSEE